MINQGFDTDALRSVNICKKLLQANSDAKQLVDTILMEQGVLENE